MKVLLVNDHAAPVGGAEIMTLMLRDGLRERGHDARLFASSARPGGILGSADYECFGTTSRFRALLQTANPWAYWRLRRVLEAFEPDVVHVKLFLTQLSPLILPLLRDVPSLYHVVWYRPICPLGTKMLPDGTACRVRAGPACYRNHCLPLHDWAPLMLQMRLWRRWRSAFDLIVANSDAIRLRLQADGIDAHAVVWGGSPSRSPRGPLVGPPTVAFAGRLVREKGVDVLLRAFAAVAAALPEARLLLAGDGPERERLRALIADLGLSSRVSMLGYLPRAELERQFDAAWVQVVPSRWAEPFGIVATDAMMRGTAVVASRSGGLAESVRDGETGLLVPPDDVDALAAALLRPLRDRALAERMGSAGREVALAGFGEGTFVENFLRLYRTLVSKERAVDIG